MGRKTNPRSLEARLSAEQLEQLLGWLRYKDWTYKQVLDEMDKQEWGVSTSSSALSLLHTKYVLPEQMKEAMRLAGILTTEDLDKAMAMDGVGAKVAQECLTIMTTPGMPQRHKVDMVKLMIEIRRQDSHERNLDLKEAELDQRRRTLEAKERALQLQREKIDALRDRMEVGGEDMDTLKQSLREVLGLPE